MIIMNEYMWNQTNYISYVCVANEIYNILIITI